MKLSVRLGDTLSPSLKRKIRRCLGKKEELQSVTLRGYDWCYERSFQYRKDIKRKQSIKIKTDMAEYDQMPVYSYCVDQMFEDLLKEDKYTLRDILVVMNPYGKAPLCGMTLFSTNINSYIKVTIEGAIAYSYVCEKDALSKHHRIPIVGLYANKKNEVLIEAFDEKNILCDSHSFFITTKEAPEGMTELVHTEKNKRLSNDMTLIYGGDTRYPYVFDQKGKLRYYLKRTPKPYGLYLLSNGRFLFAERFVLGPAFSNPHSTQILEMDYLGRVYNIYYVKNGIHHDAIEKTPGGNILALSSSFRDSEEDTVIELDRNTGKIVKQICMLDYFDQTYQVRTDWAHINSIYYDKESRNVILCLRNLHTTLSINWDNGNLQWVLGHPEFYKGTNISPYLLQMEEGMPWFFQSHSAYFVEDWKDKRPHEKVLCMYDNHWNKRTPVEFFDKDSASYVSFYGINEKEKTVRLLKRLPCPKTSIRSNALVKMNEKKVVAMNGYLEPPIGEIDGSVQEFDLESGELLKEYYLTYSFYRGYDFLPDYNVLSRKMPENKDYIKGEMQGFHLADIKSKEQWNILNIQKSQQKQEKKEEYKGKKMRKSQVVKSFRPREKTQKEKDAEILEIRCMRKENQLFLYGRDHLIECVYLSSKENIYEAVHNETRQVNQALFGESRYYVVYQLSNILSGQYKIIVKCYNKYYDLGYTVIIEET